MSLLNSNSFSNPYSTIYPIPGNETKTSLYNSSSQIAEIEAKMAMHEMEYTKQNNILQDRIKQYIIAETDLKRELAEKNTEIINLNEKINTIIHETEYSKEKFYQNANQLNQLTNSYKLLQTEYEKMFRNLTEIKNENNEFRGQIDQLIYENDNKENEINTLNTLIEKYVNDINELTSKLTISEKEKENMETFINDREKQNMSMKEKNIALSKENETLIYELENLQKKIKDNNMKINELENTNNNYVTENFNLSKTVTKLQVEIEELRELKKNLEKEKENTKNIKTIKEKAEFDYQNELIKLKGDISNIISISNDNIESIVHWIDNYFTNLYSPGVQLPEININNYFNEQLPFEKIKKSLLNAKNKVDTDLSSALQKNKEIKTVLTKGQDDYYRMQKYIEDLNMYISNEIELGKYFVVNKDSFQFEKDSQKEIEDNLNKIFTLLKRKKVSVDENYINQLIEDNTVLNRNLNELKMKSENIFNENISLDKKNKSLQKEIDLKKAQIKAQEEILSRRNALEEDNKKLLKDNITLINKLKVLKNKKEDE